ncbi:MAG: flagellar motor protein MotB [Elusimicrobia bacterium]|nr:flagellar motor protein MotB [Elusimicrobiota bacterium]
MPIRPPKGFIDETDPKVAQIGHPAPAWLVNYADLMTELVCFFVILYALSAALNKNIVGAESKLKKMMKDGQMAGSVEMNREGLKISLTESGQVPQFDVGFADLTAGMKKEIDEVAPVLKELAEQGNEIIVEGHTDDKPIHNDYFWGNWELSSARATTVVEYLIRKKGFPAGCLAAMGYGDARPIAPNDTPEGRSKNRRVVFFVKSTGLSKGNCAAPPGAQLPPTPLPPPGAKPGQAQEASG